MTDIKETFITKQAFKTVPYAETVLKEQSFQPLRDVDSVALWTFAEYRIPKVQTTPVSAEQAANHGNVCAFLGKKGDQFGAFRRSIEEVDLKSKPRAIMSTFYDLFVDTFGRSPASSFGGAVARVSLVKNTIVFCLHVSGVSKMEVSSYHPDKSHRDFAHINTNDLLKPCVWPMCPLVDDETRYEMEIFVKTMMYAADPHVSSPEHIGSFSRVC